MYCKIEAAKYRRTVASKVVSQVSSTNTFEKKNMRLREYAEYFYMATNCTPIERLTIEKLVSTLEKAQKRSDQVEAQILKLVFDALLSYVTSSESVKFDGCLLECHCGGNYSLNKPSWKYECNTCGIIGRADPIGLPCSLPALPKVRNMRNTVHRLVDKVLAMPQCHLSFDDLYTIIAYKTQTPLPYMHLGWMTKEVEVEKVIAALNELETLFIEGAE